MNGFADFQNRAWIRATLEMQTALAVGSRVSLDPVGTDMPVMKDPYGRPLIPGSSIKGVVRSLAERILRTVNRRPDWWACDPFDQDTMCISPSRRDELWREAGEKDGPFTELLMTHSCTACRLFGSPWMAGRVAFKDAYLANPEALPITTQIRDGVGIDRDLGAARSGVKYDFETVVPGAQFAIEVVTENLKDWELGFLLTVLRLWEEGGIALGGKTTRGPGWGVLKDIQITRVTRETLMDYLTTGATTPGDVESLREAFWRKWQEGNHA